MKLSRSIAIAVGACLVLAMSGPPVAVQGQEPSQIDVWTPLPVKPNPFVPPHKAVDQALGGAREAQRSAELVRAHR